MVSRIKDFGRCNVCNRWLKQAGVRCTRCSTMYNEIRSKNRDLSDDDLVKLVKERLEEKKLLRRKSVNSFPGAKPKFLKVAK